MTDIQRYEMNHKGLPELDDNGVWVLREEHDNVVAQLQEQMLKLTKDRNSAIFASNYRQEKIDNLKDRLNRSEDYSIIIDMERMELHEKMQKLTAENIAMKAGAEKAKEVVQSSIFEYWEDRGKLMDAILLITHSPATDAVICEIGAKAVEGFLDSEFCGQEAYSQVNAYLKSLSVGEQP